MRAVPPKAKTVPPGLDAEPAVVTGTLVGYARVSTRDQNLDRQSGALIAAGCLRVFADEKSGKTSARPELEKALDFMRPGDTWSSPAWTGSRDRCRTSCPGGVRTWLRRKCPEWTRVHAPRRRPSLAPR
jgi:Resolvase, N terminal domain